MTNKFFKRSAAFTAILIAVMMAFAALATLIGCGKPAATLTELNKTELTLVAGSSETLKATPSRDLEEGEVIAWASDKTDVATVDANGKVTAVAGGTAVITASINESSLTCTVTVTDKYELTLDRTAATIFLANTKKTATIGASLTKNDVAVTNPSIEWASSDSAVATVANGVVTGLTAGTAKITATCEGKTAECAVSVVAGKEYTAIAQEKNVLTAGNWYRFEADDNAKAYTDAEIKKDDKIEITKPSRLDLFKVHVDPDNESSAWVNLIDNVNNFDKAGGAKFYGYEYLFNVNLSANGNFDLIVFATKALTSNFSNGHRGIYLNFTDGKIELKQSGVGGDNVLATAAYEGKITDITSVSFGVTRLSNTEILLNLSVNGERVELVGTPSNGAIKDGGYLDNYSVNQSNGYGQRFCVVPAENTTVTISGSETKISTTNS